MSSHKEWAHFYLSQGLPIIPVQQKLPCVEWKKYQRELPTKEQIDLWWSQYPDAGIALITGEISNRIVVDIDGPLGQAWLDNLGIKTETLVIKTRRGRQYHFTWPTGVAYKTTVAGIVPEVDVRGSGGIVLLPPSITSDGVGRYEFISPLETPLAPPPQALLGLLAEKNKPRQIDIESGESWLKEKLDGLAIGNRNQTFCSIAGRLRADGYSADDIYLLLASKANEVAFDLQELRTITESVSQYSPKAQVNTEAQSVSDFLADEQTVEWIVPGLLAKRSINFIHGMPMTAKSWMVFDLAITMAKGGGLWLGKFPTSAGKVLLVEAERFRGETQRRLRALLNTANAVSSTIGSKLVVKTGSTTRLNLPQSFDAFRKLLAEHKPDLIIWDSFATAHTVGETDRMSIQAVLENIKSLRDEFGCALFFVNHDTKQSLQHQPGESKQPSMSDMQGNIAVSAVAEMMLSVKRKDNETCMVYNVKNTLSSAIEPFSVSVIDVDNGIRVEGK